MTKYVLICLVILIFTTAATASAIDFENATIKGLNITDDFNGAISEAKTQNKSIALIFDQNSCVYCEILKDDVLTNSDIQKELNENYIVVLLDINKNPNIAAKYDVFGTPTMQFLDSNSKEIGKIEGYVDSAEFLKTLKEI